MGRAEQRAAGGDRGPFGPAPSDGLHGLRAHWRQDVLSGFLVFLIALPLCLGIAMASGFPPIAGIITAVVGGVVAPFFGSAPLTIKGPAAGLIVIALGAVRELGGGAVGYRRTLAVIVVAAVFQILLSFLRAGALGDLFPSSVIHGMMAAIGVIIVSRQGHALLGATPDAGDPLRLLAQLPRSVRSLHPTVAAIGGISLLILWGMPRLPWAWARKIPPPVVVVAVGILLARAFGLHHEALGMADAHGHSAAPSHLVPLSAGWRAALTLPDWSVVGSGPSVKYIVTFALVGSIESMLSAKAVDSLDPWRRRSSLDRDLLSTGVGNLVAGLLGGLPMISEIVRSSANVSAGARTRWSNFFHGVFLFLFVAAVPWLLRAIPLSALAAMLVSTGIRLASPREFAKSWRIGPAQLVILLVTMAATLATDLLVGVGVGIVTKAIVHLLGGMPLRAMFKPSITESVEAGVKVLSIGHAAVFCNYLAIKRALANCPNEPSVVVDLSATRVVDHTVLEALQGLADDWAKDGRRLVVRGLEGHRRASDHPFAEARRAAR
jgi:MFS superfamily sulfate permease-like transporter